MLMDMVWTGHCKASQRHCQLRRLMEPSYIACCRAACHGMISQNHEYPSRAGIDAESMLMQPVSQQHYQML